MGIFVLDTTTISFRGRGHPRVTTELAAHGGDTVVVTAVNMEEVLGGWYRKLRAARTNAQKAAAYASFANAMTLLGTFPIVLPTEAALDKADRLARLRLNVGRTDLTIAAVALTIGATVVTNNVRDFGRVPGLLVEDWSA